MKANFDHDAANAKNAKKARRVDPFAVRWIRVKTRDNNSTRIPVPANGKGFWFPRNTVRIRPTPISLTEYLAKGIR